MAGAVALQLVACGNATGGGDEQVLRESVRRDRGVEGARHGRGDGVRHNARPVHAKPRPGCGPVVTPPGGWEAVRCAGAATRRVRMVANLDASTQGPWLPAPFNAERPWTTSAFSSTFTGFDDQGRPQTISLYFGRLQQGWDYHAVMDGTAFVVGAGRLSFDDQGLVTVEVTQELRLLTASGPGHAITLDLSGVTQLAAPCEVMAQAVDGSEARWGRACSASEPLPEEPAVTGPSCATAATTRWTLRANLAAASPIAKKPWNPLAPVAGLKVPLQVNDADGALIDFELFLRKSSADTWEYHVLLVGDAHGVEVAHGSLSFNANGSLGAVTNARALRFPNHAGVLGDVIELDFGAVTASGGNGVDGVTSLPGGSLEVWQQRDGAVLDCLPRVSSTPLPAWHPSSCAGERTTAVSLGFNLDPASPLNPNAPYSASFTIYDPALIPKQAELRFWHIEERRWQCQVIVSAVEEGVVDIHFAPNGAPELVENIPLLRLPLADGSAGPLIQLAFDEGWAITSFPAESSGWLAPNGAPANSEGCVE